MPAGLVWMTVVAAGCRNIYNEPVLLDITHYEIQREYSFRPYRSWSVVVLECQKLKWFLLREC